MNPKILLTGSTGFIGRKTLIRLQSHFVDIIAPVRASWQSNDSKVSTPFINDIVNLPQLFDSIKEVDVIIHIAAKAHVAGISLAEFRHVNTQATLNLAKEAARRGVKRFIFLSSIGVNGISSPKPFTVFDPPSPCEDYAVSKLDAEIGLTKISAESGMEVVIIRPPLVYGADAPGNFGKLSKLAQQNLPLPLGAIHNKRSLVALDNLVDLIVTCIDHPNAANQTFLVSDDQDVSTTRLLQLMTSAAGKQPRLLPVPVSWLRLAGKLTGKSAVIDRLCGNLQVDITHTKETLGWKPPITLEEGIARCFSNVEC
ncbi:UDP-glucose 4-epimerase family protein [Alkalimonas mucilaginosa]|uniref:SDR family oxidoreductase n=1 Tax=Alkalimonas mucilaginosa TaxID=3057676 RepID=A0ABU7JBG6_9GAMM|nr:SDR family oxidoreductase [Alkalimonas sp. MEB004]MEE2023037.1 SDR family oxidoreductase [Alkalimonas sp. MEB004]